MKNIEININTIAKAEAFLNLIKSLEGEFELVSDSSVVNAKSTLDVLCLNIEEDLQLIVKDDDMYDEAISLLEEYIVKK